MDLIRIVLLGCLFFGFSLSASAQVEEPVLKEECTDFAKNLGSFRYHRFLDRENKCWLSALPTRVTNLVYRSYLYTSEGYLMVFNSIDKEEYGVSDGARSFLFFPRNEIPTAADIGDLVYFKSGTKGVELILDTQEARIVGMVGGTVKEDRKVYPGNNGGVEFSNVQALILDGGWKAYGDPFGEMNRQSTFIDPKGNRCVVRNREVFKLDSDEDPRFRFTDVQLKTFLANRCPKLELPF
jgi:hypothetical protein